MTAKLPSEDDCKKVAIDLYKIIVDEIHKYHILHQQRIAFFSGLIVSLLIATAIGIYKASAWYHYLFLAIGPILVVIISIVAIRGIHGIYRLLLESITTRARLEHYMGFAKAPFTSESNNGNNKKPICKLNIVPLRHEIHRDIYSRGIQDNQYGLASKWIKKLLGEDDELDNELKKKEEKGEEIEEERKRERKWLYHFLHQGFQRWTNLYFFLILVIGLTLTAATITLAVYKFNDPLTTTASNPLQSKKQNTESENHLTKEISSCPQS